MELTDILRKFGKTTAIVIPALASYFIGSNYSEAQQIQNYNHQPQSIAIERKEPFWKPKDVMEIGRKARLGRDYVRVMQDQARMVQAQPSDSFYRAAGSQTINIDESWSYTEINNVMDGNSSTKGKNNTSDPLAYSGDTILFKKTKTGLYQTPAQQSASFENYIPGITIQSEPGVILQNDSQVSTGT